MPKPFPVTEHTVKSARHTTGYLACGASGAPPIIFVHGWPELSISWRHQLPCLAQLGFHAIAPDMRGYGRSSIYPAHQDYAVEHSVADMLELLASLGHDKAVWVGHDWGSPVVWSIASHHPDVCHGVANLCVPHLPQGFSPASAVPLVDRAIYPEAEFPAGQWDYQLFYEENFAAATSAFQADAGNTVRALFRKGVADGQGKPSALASIRRRGGWFQPLGKAPDVPRDSDVLSDVDCAAYAAALQRNGFFGPDSWYMNHRQNAAYAAQAPNDGRIDLPVLFLHAEFDYTCATVGTRLADPMRAACPDLTEAVVRSGHWMAQENPVAVNAALVRWLAVRFPTLWESQ